MRSVMSQLTPATTCLVADRMQRSHGGRTRRRPARAPPFQACRRRPGEAEFGRGNQALVRRGPRGVPPMFQPSAGRSNRRSSAETKIIIYCAGPLLPRGLTPMDRPASGYRRRRLSGCLERQAARCRCPHRPARWCSQVRPRAWGRGGLLRHAGSRRGSGREAAEGRGA